MNKFETIQMILWLSHNLGWEITEDDLKKRYKQYFKQVKWNQEIQGSYDWLTDVMLTLKCDYLTRNKA